MCGRFAFYSPAEAVAALFDAEPRDEFEPRYNIAPTQDIAAVRPCNDGRELVALRWGLVPFWAKDPSVGNRMINARAETVAGKPAYRNAYRHRRCVIPADGFYEWHRENDVKTPWFISRADGDPFGFAGLWEEWTDKGTGEILQTATIITTAADRFMERLHHRMPVILDADAAAAWLGGDEGPLQTGEGLPRMRAWPVDRRVNNARNEGEDLVEPAGAAIESGAQAGARSSGR